MYGESAIPDAAAPLTRGLSPRVRGIRGGADPGRGGAGSIPACTGNPTSAARRRRPCRVYPRVYGESRVRPRNPVTQPGLSPRVRGILSGRPDAGAYRGSIPACTGNPATCTARRRRRRVYPRVYGESSSILYVGHSSLGLSPRVRGIQRLAHLAWVHDGSIPACTGNPILHCRPALLPGVYPRVYGESKGAHVVPRLYRGLSPRVRGIHG